MLRVVRGQRVQARWGEVVRRLREARGWSQMELARRAGVGQSRVSDIETGDQDARASTLAGIADALEVSVDFLLGRTVAAEDPQIGRIVTAVHAALLAEAEAERRARDDKPDRPGVQAPLDTLNTETAKQASVSQVA